MLEPLIIQNTYFRNRRFTIPVQIVKNPRIRNSPEAEDTLKMFYTMRLTLTALTISLFASQTALAEGAITIKTDQTQIISVSSSPGTVITGNPSIADVTVHGNNVFLHGRAFGTTNLIVLSKTGEQLLSTEVTVANGAANTAAMFSPGGGDFGGIRRVSYVCAPLCEAAMQPGDPLVYTQELVKSNSKKSDLATGKTSAASEND